MLVGSVVVTFVVLTLLSLPIVFALGLAGFTGLLVGNFSLTKLPSSLVAGSQSWVLLAIPTFVFAGSLMERCGMSYALVDLARALVGSVRGGLGLSVVVAEYFFSGISGSTIADVSANEVQTLVHLLATELDDVIDLIDGTARRVAMFHIDEGREPARYSASG